MLSGHGSTASGIEKMEAELERLASAVGSIEREFGLENGFLVRLSHGDDWSFVIRSHALIESMVSRLLTAVVGDARLSEFFERLELSDRRVGKLAVAENLATLKSEERGFVRLLSELRNRVVHNARYLNFDLRAYYDGLDRNQKRSFLKTGAYWFSKPPEQLPEPVRTEPKSILWFGLLALIVRVTDRLGQIER